MRNIGLIVLLTVGLTMACGGEKEKASSTSTTSSEGTKVTPTPPTTTDKPKTPKLPPKIEAKLIFKARCVLCHGPTGEGNGPSAASLNPKPRNYTDPKWQDSITDQVIKDIIVKGGKAVGKSEGMPAQPDLAAKPKVLDEIVKKIRSFRKAE